MSIPQSAGGQIESRDDLVRHLSRGCKPASAWRIGTEHEKFVYDLRTRKPLAYEGAPGILREALAAGTPVVSTDSSAAVRELVPGPAAGTVVAVGDQEALVAALDHWLAPGRARPTPIPEPGLEAGTAYLALFDRVVAACLRA